MSSTIDQISPSKWRIRNDLLCVEVDVHCGGNITSLEDRVRHIQWLWHNPHLPATPITQGSSPVDYGRDLDRGGWDDIWLSVAAAEIDSVERRISVPDHGDLVGRAVSSVRHTHQQATHRLGTHKRGTASLTTEFDGIAARYHFTRTLSMHADTASLEMDYCVTAEEHLPWLWSAHPLFPIIPSLKIDAGISLENFHTQSRIESSALSSEKPSEKLRWPKLGDLALNEFGTVATGIAAKVFIPATGEVRLSRNDNNESPGSLTMRWDKHKLPWLGLWINDGGWSGLDAPPYRNVGIEPTSCPYDNVANAHHAEALEWLEPGQSKRWTITLDLAD